MAKGKRTGKGHELRYNAYKMSKTYETNRRKRLERALKRNPENKQIEEALKSIVYRRSTPNEKQWGSTKRRTAELFKLFTGAVNMEIFHNNEKISSLALLAAGPKSAKIETQYDFRRMFSIGARIA